MNFKSALDELQMIAKVKFDLLKIPVKLYTFDKQLICESNEKSLFITDLVIPKNSESSDQERSLVANRYQ